MHHIAQCKGARASLVRSPNAIILVILDTQGLFHLLKLGVEK